MARQLTLDFNPDPLQCKHWKWGGYATVAVVPSGVYCHLCDTLISQQVVYPNEPEMTGYESADWAWHFKYGKPWTSMPKLAAPIPEHPPSGIGAIAVSHTQDTPTTAT